MNLRDGLAGLILVGALGAFMAFAVLQPKFPVHVGNYTGTMHQAHGSVSYKASQKWLVEIDDGRAWWIEVPPSEFAAPGDDVRIRLMCQSEAAERCRAIYLGQ